MDIQRFLQAAFFFLALSGGCTVTAGLSAQTRQAVTSPSGQATLLGSVYEKTKITMERPMPVASFHLRLWQQGQRDTLRYAGNRTGDFELTGVVPGKYRVRVTCVGYTPFEAGVELVPGKNVIMVGLEKTDYRLKAASVTAQSELMKQKGDTVIYNAAAVRTMEGDNALAILKQLPGVNIDEKGKIFVMGEPVVRTYVNGTLVFGDNPMNAMDALLAQEVTQMKVYDEQSVDDRLRGARHSRKERVIDIQTRSPIVSATDAYVLASYGADGKAREDGSLQQRYALGVTANFFSEKLLLHGAVFGNNINRTGNTFRDFSVFKPLTGYAEKTVASAGLARYGKDRLKGNYIKLDYTFSRDWNDRRSHSRTEYLETESCPSRVTADTSSSSSLQNVHHLQLDAGLRQTKAGSFRYTADFSLFHDRAENVRGESAAKDGSLYARGRETHRKRLENWDFSNMLAWEYKKGVKGYFPALCFQMNAGEDNGHGRTLDTLSSSFHRRNLSTSLSGKHFSFGGDVSLMKYLINSERQTLQIKGSYGLRWRRDMRNQYATDALSGDAVDLSNTFDYRWDYLSHLAEFRSDWNRGKLNVTASLSYEEDHLEDREYFPSPGFRGRPVFRAVLPGAHVKYKSWEFGYRADRWGLPSMQQIRPQVDDRNPLLLQLGNPDLDAPYRHQILFAWKRVWPKKNLTLQLGGNQMFLQHAIVSRMQYFSSDATLDGLSYPVKAGSTLTTWENAEGQRETSLNLGLTRRIKPLKGMLSVMAVARYLQRPMVAGADRILSREWLPYFRTMLRVSPSRQFRSTARLGISFADSRNDRGGLLSSAFSPSFSFNAEYRFLKYMFVRGDYYLDAHLFVRGIGKDLTLQTMNAAVGCRLAKNRLILSLSGTDLLSRGSSYSRTLTALTLQEHWTPTYGRYFLLNLCWRFNRNKSKVRFAGELDDGFRAPYKPDR